MPHDPRLAVRIAAFAAAQSAKAGTLDRDTVVRLHVQAARILPPDDVLRRAIDDFVRRYRAASDDAGGVADLGRSLSAFIDALNMPAPPDLDRRDIYG